MNDVPEPVLVTCNAFPRLVIYRGPVASFPIYMAELDRPEKVIASSNKFWFDNCYQAVVGFPRARHHHLIRLLVQLLGDQYEREFVYPRNQGFMTSHGRLIGRLEARKIAEDQHQLLTTAYKHRELFSEDIW